MLNYVRQFIKIRVVFHTLYIWNEDGDPQFFFCISGTSKSLSDCIKNFKKIYRVENFRANVLNGTAGLNPVHIKKLAFKNVRAKIFQHWFFSKTFTSVRWWFSYVKNVKKLGGHRLRFAENMPGRSPQIWKNRALLANNASVCKPKNIAIKSSKWNVLCQILFKWTS